MSTTSAQLSIDIISSVYMLSLAKQARDIEHMLLKCWASVVDVGPMLQQHLINVSCLQCSLEGPSIFLSITRDCNFTPRGQDSR